MRIDSSGLFAIFIKHFFRHDRIAIDAVGFKVPADFYELGNRYILRCLGTALVWSFCRIDE